MNAPYFDTETEAIEAERLRIFGRRTATVPVADRKPGEDRYGECRVGAGVCEPLFVQVGRRLVTFAFDNYGRVYGKSDTGRRVKHTDERFDVG